MLNKYLFGLLVNTTAIFASISSDVVAKEGLHKFRNQLNQIAWDCYCCWEEFELRADLATKRNIYHRHYWILDDKYKKSRTTVIGNAIADCVTGENEFAGKKPNDIITFKDTDPVTYKQKHWNAVILYNYIHAVISGGKKSKKVAEVLKEKLEKIKTYYKDYFLKEDRNDNTENVNQLINDFYAKLDHAIKYIQEYADALILYAQLDKFRDSKRQYDNNQDTKDIAPDVNIRYSDEEKLMFYQGFYKLDEEEPLGKRFLYCPTFRYAGDKLYISGVSIREDKWNQNANQGHGDWESGENKSIGIEKFDSKQEPCKFLLERLHKLVKLPNEKLRNEWNRKS